MKLKNKVALITGGSSGIGKAIAKRFLSEGAKVIVFGLKKPDYNVEFYKVDVTKEDQIKKILNKIKKLDILVNNSGIMLGGNVETGDTGDFDKTMDINLRGPYLMCKYFTKLLKESRGCIVNIASILGTIPNSRVSAYCISKAGIIMLTKCLAQEYVSYGVRVNAILPGPIDTKLLRNAFPSEKAFKEFIKATPMKRLGKPEEVANVVFFLVSAESSFVTGGLYTVDGGYLTSKRKV